MLEFIHHPEREKDRWTHREIEERREWANNMSWNISFDLDSGKKNNLFY
jgi:hypothetical protein